MIETFLSHLNLTVHLGLLPKIGDDSSIPNLADFVDTTVLPAPLQSSSYIAKPAAWDEMYGNDTVGDCTIAGALHLIGTWMEYATGQKPNFTTAQALQVYYLLTGGPDSGLDLMTVLNYWKTTGILGHKILGFVKLSAQNTDLVHLAIELFGGVYPGVQLPISAQAQVGKEWVPVKGPSGVPGGWGGHCPPIIGYSTPDGIEDYSTWGMIQKGNPAFRKKYMNECYAVLGPEWVNGQKQAPNGFDLTALLAYLQVI